MNENEIQFQKRINAMQMINFFRLLKNLLRWVFHLEMANGQGSSMSWERYVSRILQPSPAHHLFLKAISEVQHSGETGKEIQLNFPPIEESGPRENGWGRVELFSSSFLPGGVFFFLFCRVELFFWVDFFSLFLPGGFFSLFCRLKLFFVFLF